MKKPVMALTLLTAILAFSCSRQYQSETLFAGNSTGMSGRDAEFRASQDSFYQSEKPASDVSESAILNDFERKLVKSAFIRLRVENLESADISVSGLMGRYNAYAASTSIQDNSRYYSLRVPSNQYDNFLAEMNGLGRLLYRSENIEDVTLRYYNLDGRLESMRGLLRTFQSYLGRANNIEEILSVEARIADLQREIEFVGTQLRNLANQVDYSAIDLNLLGPVTASINRGETLGERIMQLFNNFGGFLSTVAVFLLGIVVYGIPSLLVLAILFWILFGRIGLLKKLWHLIARKSTSP